MSNELSAEYIKAVDLNRKIITAAQLAQQSLYDMCMGFKEMRDSRLYKELGYQNFEEYCQTETGFKRRQVYNYINIVEKLGEENVQSIAQIGMTKLTLLSTLSEVERTEITESNDLENTSVRELEQQIKQLKAEKDKAIADCSAVEAEAENRNGMISALEKSKQALNDKISRLEADIKSLESRPVETAIQYVDRVPENYVTPEAYERDVTEAIDRANEVEEELIKEKQRAYAEKVALEEQIEKLKNQPAPAAEPVKVVDTKAVFKAHLATAIDATNRLITYINEHYADDGIDICKDRAKQLLTTTLEALK